MSELKVGNHVFVMERGTRIIRLSKIIGETKTLWKIEGGLRFKKDDLSEYGAKGWYRLRIKKANPNEIDEYKRNIEKEKLKIDITGVLDSKNVTLEQLKEVAKILNI